MEKSFYFVVSWSDSAERIAELNRLAVPFAVELHTPGQNRFVIPSVPVRQYTEIRKLFGGDGEAYRSNVRF